MKAYMHCAAIIGKIRESRHLITYDDKNGETKEAQEGGIGFKTAFYEYTEEHES